MKQTLFIIILLFVIGCSNEKKDSNPLTQVTVADINVPTIMCDMCEGTITKALENLEGVKGIDVDLDKKIAHIKYVAAQTNVETIEHAITDVGYDANDKKRNPDAYADLPACCKND